MKKKALNLLIVMFVMVGLEVNAQEAGRAKNVLVAYFSWSGNTRVVAEQIRELTGGDLFEIKTVKEYPEEYRPCTEVAKKEKEADARPELQGKLENLSRYDVVFVGYPNWWGTAPMAVWTFLGSYDWTDKTLIPYCTHGGGGEQNCFKDFVKHKGKAQAKKGFITNGGRVNVARPQVEKWLAEIGLK